MCPGAIKACTACFERRRLGQVLQRSPTHRQTPRKRLERREDTSTTLPALLKPFLLTHLCTTTPLPPRQCPYFSRAPNHASLPASFLLGEAGGPSHPSPDSLSLHRTRARVTQRDGVGVGCDLPTLVAVRTPPNQRLSRASFRVRGGGNVPPHPPPPLPTNDRRNHLNPGKGDNPSSPRPLGRLLRVR